MALNKKNIPSKVLRRMKTVANIVEDIDLGKEINLIYKYWHVIRTNEEYNAWITLVKNFKLGTYGTKKLLDVLDNFNPQYPNSFHKKEFIVDLKRAYSSQSTLGGYKWKPSKTQRKEFAKKMSEDSQFAADYYARKEKKATKRRAGSKFDYNSAGGEYVPTKAQHDFCINHSEYFETPEEKNAANMVSSAYSLNEKTHHDYIHIVNEKIRKFNSNNLQGMALTKKNTGAKKQKTTNAPTSIQKHKLEVKKLNEELKKAKTLLKKATKLIYNNYEVLSEDSKNEKLLDTLIRDAAKLGVKTM